LIAATSQEECDVSKFGNPEVILADLRKALEDLEQRLEYSYIHEACQELRLERIIIW
jgi:hypothetical protein